MTVSLFVSFEEKDRPTSDARCAQQSRASASPPAARLGSAGVCESAGDPRMSHAVGEWSACLLSLEAVVASRDRNRCLFPDDDDGTPIPSTPSTTPS